MQIKEDSVIYGSTNGMYLYDFISQLEVEGYLDQVKGFVDDNAKKSYSPLDIHFLILTKPNTRIKHRPYFVGNFLHFDLEIKAAQF